jgi:N-hydroxyarylamine O-acetyltransferase
VESWNKIVLNPLQLSAYLDLLGLERQAADHDFLDAILARHVDKVTFSALSVPLDRYYSLDTHAIFTRLVEQGIGGYCYEQNGLLQAALDALGYRVRAVMAKVVFRFDDPLVDRALTHRSALVELDGLWWMADAGFSQMSPGMALPLNGTEIDGYRVTEVRDDDWHFQQRQTQGWKTLFRFSLRECSPLEIEMGHLWSSKHPSATFVNNVMVSRIYPDKRIMMTNLSFQTWVDQQLVDEVIIYSAQQMQALLASEFNLHLSEDEVAQVYAKATQLEA